MISISLCMIVRNEEQTLSKCLDSLKDIVDEIVIVDTGSTDNTREIARKYTDKIYDFAWVDDFAAARNFSFSKATMDYIYTADADEIIDTTNQEAFIQLKKCLLPEIEIVQMKYINALEENTVYNCKKEYRPKLFKRLRSFNWISPIHETVQLEPVVFDSDIEILHCPACNHSKRDFSTFIKTVNNGVTLTNTVLIMFCKELFISGTDEDFNLVKDIFINKLSKEDRNEDCLKAIACVLARIYRLCNDYNNFFKICLKDMASTPCSEICFELGEYFYNLSDYDEAILWYTNAYSETSSILDVSTSGKKPLTKIADAFQILAESAKDINDNKLSTIYLENAQSYTNMANEWEMPEEF